MAAYLAVTAVPHTRETLATLLWPDSDRQRGRAALRTTLSVLKKAIGAEWLRVDGDIISLADGFTCDVRQFQAQIAQSQNTPPLKQISLLEEAIALYQADFLAGFTLNDSLLFDEWQFSQTETHRQTLEKALQTAVSLYEQQAQFDKAIVATRRWLTLDPLNESVHQQLMRLYAASGQKAAALRQYDILQKVLQSELGVPPTAVSQAIESMWLTYDMNNQFTEAYNAFLGFTKWNPTNHAEIAIKAKGLARLGHFAHRLGQIEQAQQWLEESLQLARSCSSEEETAFALNSCGYLYGRQGKYEQAQQAIGESIQYYRNLNDKWGLSRALNNLAIVVQSRQQTHDYLQESLAIAREIGDLWSEARLLNNLGFVVTNRTESIQLCHDCVGICRQIGDRFLLIFPLINLGNAARIMGQFQEAQQYYTESRAICEEIGYQQGQARCLGHLGATAYSLGAFKQARDHCQVGLRQCQQLGDQRGIGLDQYTLGQIALAEEKVETAVSIFQQSLSTFRQSQDRLGEAWPLLGIVECALQQNQLTEAETAVHTSLHIFKEVDDKSGLTQALALLGELSLAKQQPDEAQPYLQEALETARSLEGAGAVTLQSPPLINNVLLSIAKWSAVKQPQHAYAIVAFVKDAPQITAVTRQKATTLCDLWMEFEETAVCTQIKTFLQGTNDKTQITIFNLLTD